MAASEVPLHPDARSLAFLLGTWKGEGIGSYPTLETFHYGEEVRFWHVGKPFLAYAQRTWAPDDGRPLHSESGYWRPQPDGRMEVVVAHPTRLAELYEGRVEGRRLQLTTLTVARTPTAKEVTAAVRTFTLGDGDVLAYTVDMAAVGQSLQRHLQAELRRALGAGARNLSPLLSPSSSQPPTQP